MPLSSATSSAAAITYVRDTASSSRRVSATAADRVAEEHKQKEIRKRKRADDDALKAKERAEEESKAKAQCDSSGRNVKRWLTHSGKQRHQFALIRGE